ncbi:MAG: OmpH family outer membrane protein [Dictyoglomus sp.]|nr:OmpH family outer membrane protein [Dictyoglomus sp.]MCX7942816.1 OmpH family outer membrane protein [Dictyoglomaceae bacterium]MDW8188376.1 OmpH family outer membrane protein [Dictyoglomus sp.]
MKNYKVSIILVIAIAFLFMGLRFVTAQTPAVRIAYVDQQKIIQSYTPLFNAYNKLNQEYQTRLSKLQEAQQQGKSQEEIKKLADQYDKELLPYKQAVDTLMKEVEKAFSELAKKEGYNVVLDKNAVVWGGIDITDKIISQLTGKK